MWLGIIILTLLLVAVAIYDVTQRKHAILRNFPIIGHLGASEIKRFHQSRPRSGAIAAP